MPSSAPLLSTWWTVKPTFLVNFCLCSLLYFAFLCLFFFFADWLWYIYVYYQFWRKHVHVDVHVDAVAARTHCMPLSDWKLYSNHCTCKFGLKIPNQSDDLLDRPLQWDYLSVITHDLVQARGRAVIVIIRYYDYSGSSANSNSSSLGSAAVRKNSRMVIVSKWHSNISHGGNNLQIPSRTTAALRYTILYHRDPLAADDGSRKQSTNLEHRPRGNNEGNDVKLNVRGFSDRRRRVMRNK